MQPKNKTAPEPAENTEIEIDADAFSKSYGSWLQKILKDKGITPSKLSEDSGISMPAIYNIISGRSKNPQQKTKDFLEKALKAKPKSEEVIHDTSNTEETPISDLGELTDFDPHNEVLLPDCSGVYVFYDITDRPVYVGRASKNARTIKARVREHFDKFWFKPPIVHNGAYIEISDDALCQKIERALIKFLKSNAVLNKHYVIRDK